MKLQSFNGIGAFHDGSVVSEYNNVIPMKTTAIDRLGEKLLNTELKGQHAPRGWTVDSLGVIWIAVNEDVWSDEYHQFFPKSYIYRMNKYGGTVRKIDITEISQGNATIDFCEASLTPTTMFILIDGRIWYMPTDLKVDNDRLMPFGMPEDTFGSTPDKWGQNSPLVVTTISWYDNRLIATDIWKNTVWISEVDPMQFIRNYGTDNLQRWDNNTDNLWLDFIVPTLAPGRLRGAEAFNGQLYVHSDDRVEVWSRTGNADVPLEINPNATIYTGVRGVKVINDLMYCICVDAVDNYSLGVIDKSNTLTRISTEEIEKRYEIMDHVHVIRQRQTSFISVARHPVSFNDADETYCLGPGGWWKWENKSAKEYVIDTLSNGVHVTNLGRLCVSDENTRTRVDGTTINRYIRDYFVHPAGRAILRNFEVVCDTGRFMGDPDKSEGPENSMYLTISTNRGQGFGRVYYRKLGVAGKNDKVIIFRNLGSGNSFVFEFGTAANAGFQIYEIRVELV